MKKTSTKKRIRCEWCGKMELPTKDGYCATVSRQKKAGWKLGPEKQKGKPKCESCEEVKPLDEDGLCKRCARWSRAATGGGELRSSGKKAIKELSAQIRKLLKPGQFVYIER